MERRAHLCYKIALMQSNFRNIFFDAVEALAEGYPACESPEWECTLCKGPDRGLYLIPKNKAINILIVEDQKVMADSMTVLCESIPDLFVKVVHTGGAAIDILMRYDFYSVVILDIKLPDMDGLEVLEQARKYMPETLFYVVSGYDTEENRTKAKDMGAADFIAKPFDPEALCEMIKNAVSSLRQV